MSEKTTRIIRSRVLTTKDAIVLAYSNPSFMEELLADPAAFAEQFKLPPQAVSVLSKLDPDQVRAMSGFVRDPVEFGRSVEVIANMAATNPY
jgi:hypothetical protein